MSIFLAWFIFLLAIAGLSLPVLVGRWFDGWQKEMISTIVILLICVFVAGYCWFFFRSDFITIYIRTLLFEGLPYGFALRYITIKRKVPQK